MVSSPPSHPTPGDPDGFGDLFSDPFLLADDAGARPVPRAAFLAALPRRARLFADAGLGPATLTGLTCQRLDDRYVLARTDWDAPRAAGGAPVRLASSYLLHDDGERFRVVLYLNHQGLPGA
ncbi:MULTISPECIES: nuclear transport factor 2 family protein [Micromonospora]|uniref:nuclear transport factor 2 family protein n=1 Tax=Micromonospora TaxID=1873 RepID=UPI0011CEB37B|nr:MULTISPECIES: nuclear transport factor 2 family protein [Micromonospora]NES13172.1 nuclear transport factor 2 family protein [Micromonospora sp. PPF5-17B]NES36263.1 nuclear transport factor 2 family protein [Micromonospora solifontis]NES55097.1 nuclear transport factor 2 family protein [Micromonospora sp. PPF5-6]